MSVTARSISPPAKCSHASSADGAVNTLKPPSTYNRSNCLRTIISSSTTKMHGFNSLLHPAPCSNLSCATPGRVGLASLGRLSGSFMDATIMSLSVEFAWHSGLVLMRVYFHQNSKYAAVLALFSKDNISTLASKNLLGDRHTQANDMVIHSDERSEYILFLIIGQGTFGNTSDA